MTTERREVIFEIGTEELPWGAQEIAEAFIGDDALRIFSREGIEFAEMKVYSTPRRLAVKASQVESMTKGKNELIKGPPVSVAFKGDAPTKAAEGFARSQGVETSDLKMIENEKGSYVYAERIQMQKKTIDLLPDIFYEMIENLSFPRVMRWGSGDFRFPRPIRWIVALFGDEKVSLSIAGVSSGKLSYGNRVFAEGGIEISSAEEYESAMSTAGVIVSRADRRKMVIDKIEKLCNKTENKPETDEELLEEIVSLVEIPTVVMGEFGEEYLNLPEEVLTTAMKEHQKYIPIRDKHGQLSNSFIVVSNGDPAYSETVRRGNERVLRARLEDALFFYREDTKAPLIKKLDGLKGVVQHADIGTMFDKSVRLEKLMRELLSVSDYEVEEIDVEKCARLSKIDLLTDMVREFPSLQGVMGGIYSKESAESLNVAVAVGEHYLPGTPQEKIPSNHAGQLLSIADRLDNIASCFGIGLIPTGSEDPYALRRQAQGIASIIIESGKDINLRSAIDKSFEVLLDSGIRLDRKQREAEEFVLQRFKRRWLDEGLDHDIIEAVSEMVLESPMRARSCIEALGSARSKGNLRDLYTPFERCYNLSKNMKHDQVIRNELLVDSSERELNERALSISEELESALSKRDYESALIILSKLTESVNRIFDEVMIMVEDEDLRMNRLALLKFTASLFMKVADFSKIVFYHSELTP